MPSIIHATPDKLWLSSEEGIRPGDTVSQETCIGELADLFDRFGQE